MRNSFKFGIVSSLIIVFCLSNAAAQFNQFYSGYIVTSNSDTIRGEIRFENQLRSQLECVFREESGSDVRIYSPEDLLAYQIEDVGFYSSRTISEGRFNIKKVFIVNQIIGTINLLVYRKEKGAPRFFTEKTSVDGFFELITDQKRYLGVLNFLLFDCDSYDENLLFETLFSESDISARIIEYNTCKDPGFTQSGLNLRTAENKLKAKKPKPDKILALGAAGGLLIDRIKFSPEAGSQVMFLQDAEVDQDINLMGAIGVKFSLAPTYNILSLGSGIGYSFRKFKGSENLTSTTNLFLLETHTINVPFYLEIGASRWDRVRPSLKIGLMTKLNFENANLWISETLVSPDIFLEEDQLFDFSTIEVGVMVGAGLSIPLDTRMAGIDITYIGGNGLDDGHLISSTNQLVISVSYFFLK